MTSESARTSSELNAALSWWWADVAAGAVLIAAIGAVVIGLIVIGPHLRAELTVLFNRWQHWV